MTYFYSGLYFRVWDYHVSHSRLLIRAPRDLEDDTSVNIDVTFVAVFYSEIGHLLQGIVIRDATPEEITYLRTRLSQEFFYRTRCYAIVSGGHTYFVVGGNISIETSRMSTGLVNWPPDQDADVIS